MLCSVRQVLLRPSASVCVVWKNLLCSGGYSNDNNAFLTGVCVFGRPWLYRTNLGGYDQRHVCLLTHSKQVLLLTAAVSCVALLLPAEAHTVDTTIYDDLYLCKWHQCCVSSLCDVWVAACV